MRRWRREAGMTGEREKGKEEERRGGGKKAGGEEEGQPEGRRQERI